jgi:predicted histidine transporter YuiF (NhaC family)
MKKAGFGLVLEKISPLSNVINLIKGIIIDRQDLFSLIQFIIPLLVYIGVGYFFLKYATCKFSFEGGE